MKPGPARRPERTPTAARLIRRPHVARQLPDPIALRFLTLIGERRQQVTVANHVHPARQRRLDLAAQVVPPIGREQQGHRPPVGGGAVRKAVLTRGSQVFSLEAEPLEWWESPRRIRYPVAWRLSGGGLELKVEPSSRNREVPLVGDTDTLWEGPVRVSGTVAGRGFQELVGYAREKRR